MTSALPPAIDLSRVLELAPVEASQWLVIAPVLLPLVAGAVLILLRPAAGRRRSLAVLLSLPVLVLTVMLNALLLETVLVDGPVTMVMGRWLPPFGIAFTADLLGASLALAGAIVVLLVAIMARGEPQGLASACQPHPLHLLLLAGVTGAFLTGDIFNLYVWFEVLLIASFGLLSLGPDKPAMDGTLTYGFLNLIGTTLFLIAVGLLYGLAGTLNMADLALRLPHLTRGPLIGLTALVLFAFAMKAAAFPLQFWLPASYHTPRASTAALFAGLLTKVGIYAMLRVLVMLLPAAFAGLAPLPGLVAMATMLFGGLGVVQERDLKRLPGFVLISGIGTMLAGLSLGSQQGLAGTITYALHSMLLMLALYAALFAAARLAGTGDIQKAAGLSARHPGFAGLVLALFFAAAGLPPFSGFWPKVLILKAALQAGATMLAATLLLSGLLVTVGLARVFLLVFWRPATGAQATPPDGIMPGGTGLPWTILLPLLFLVGLLLGFGLWPEPLLALAVRAADGLCDPAAYVHSVFPATALRSAP
nr:proton-conducting transporter membrane subunit [uncultured Gellertiella sp.]